MSPFNNYPQLVLIGVSTNTKPFLHYFPFWFPYVFSGYKSLMLLGYCFGFFCIKQLPWKMLRWNKTFTASEKIMLVGVMFAFQFHIYKLLGGLFCDNKTGLVLDASLSITLEYFQIVFILQINQLKNYSTFFSTENALKRMYCVCYDPLFRCLDC